MTRKAYKNPEDKVQTRNYKVKDSQHVRLVVEAERITNLTGKYTSASGIIRELIDVCLPEIKKDTEV